MMRSAGLLAPQGRTRGRRYLAGPQLFRGIAEELGIPQGSDIDRAVIVREVTERLARAQKPLAESATTYVLFPEPLTPAAAVAEYPRTLTTTKTI